VRRRAEHGVALVAAVAALAVLTVLATGLATTSVLDQHLARNALAALQADALARSGVAAAAVVLGERSPVEPDTLSARWDSGRQPLGAGWVEVRVEDEARRLDLNELADAAPALFKVLGLDHLLDALADWTDGDDSPRPAGAERDWYLGRTPPYLPPNGPLGSVGELVGVRGFDAALVERLRPFVTVAGETAINPNTAPREVLLAVVGDVTTVERLLTVRAAGPIAEEDLNNLFADRPAIRQRLTPRGQHYTLRALAGVGEIRRAIEATLDAPLDRIVAWRQLTPGG
jgi:general secretion pathway protein K